jgi:hypothetical protein
MIMALSLTKLEFPIRVGNPRWSRPQDLVVNKGTYGKMNKNIFLETTKILHIISE